MRPQWGDYHLGRACRIRPQKGDETPTNCDAPPDTRYTRTADYAIKQSRVILEKDTTEPWKLEEKVLEETCCELPEKCPDDDDCHHTWKVETAMGMWTHSIAM